MRSADKRPLIKVKQTTSVNSLLLTEITAKLSRMTEWVKRPMSWWTRKDLSESLNIRKWYFHVILCRHLSKHPLGGITLLFIIITTSNPMEGYRNMSMIQFRVGIRSNWPGNQFSRPGFMINFIRIKVNEVSNNNDYFPFHFEIQFTRSKFHYTRKWNY